MTPSVTASPCLVKGITGSPGSYSLRLISGIRRVMSHLPEEEAIMWNSTKLRKRFLAPYTGEAKIGKKSCEEAALSDLLL